MFERYTSDDRVLVSEAFVQDEIEHNLIHMISTFEDSLKIKSGDDQLIFTQSKGYNPWLWVSRDLEPEQRQLRIENLVQHVRDTAFPGITAEPNTARLFAESFCKGKEKSFHTHMMLVSYHCPVVIKPEKVNGYLLQAHEEHSAVIAEFMAGFSEDAFGMPATPQNFLSMAKEAARSGHLYLWIVNDTPVSMAKIAHLSVRCGRINEVYTPRAHRKQGYASATVAEICEMLLQENITPMLYADAKNPDSNKVYQSIGFVEKGMMTEIKFD
ncbi:GNAT family N-acetyltransferase [Paenibacillus wynnii]|uniref:GNAT family N-acetyltransferase n=1 Tax=Paenibacillus wynnii TaxID=268407 RepID=UPI00278E93A5|nr:GNAT family N-acetyltransferase [Paenibacillus wynnii]MDQ0194500.1 GNAT superfamily N-acetyltransferase [Paenibacillus wynnii]